MARTPDPRTIVGNRVHALARHVMHESKVKQQFGPNNWKTAMLDGVVVLSTRRTPEGKTRSTLFIAAAYDLQDERGTVREVKLNSRLVLPGPVAVIAQENQEVSANAMTMMTTTMMPTTMTTTHLPPPVTDAPPFPLPPPVPMSTVVMPSPPSPPPPTVVPTTTTTNNNNDCNDDDGEHKNDNDDGGRFCSDSTGGG